MSNGRVRAGTLAQADTSGKMASGSCVTIIEQQCHPDDHYVNFQFLKILRYYEFTFTDPIQLRTRHESLNWRIILPHHGLRPPHVPSSMQVRTALPSRIWWLSTQLNCTSVPAGKDSDGSNLLPLIKPFTGLPGNPQLKMCSPPLIINQWLNFVEMNAVRWLWNYSTHQVLTRSCNEGLDPNWTDLI